MAEQSAFVTPGVGERIPMQTLSYLPGGALVIVGTEDEERIGELKVSEYIIFLFALDTYMRYLEEIRSLEVNTDIDPNDTILKQGLALLRVADREHLTIVEHEIAASVTAPASLSMLKAAISLPPTARGAAIRALKLRTILSRGGTATAKAIFGKSIKARGEVREAIDAAMLEDADTALAKLAMIDIRNTRLEKWIDLASETARPLPTPDINPVQAATKVVSDSTQSLLQAGLARDGSPAASEESSHQAVIQNNTLREIERDAQVAAAKGIEKSGESDAPVTRSEAIAIATTVAAVQKADTQDIRNVPDAFINGRDRRPLDPEQMAAALTDGRVLVAAGAGAGKSTTLVSRIAYLVMNRGVKPSRIFACSFNRKAANELSSKITTKVGKTNREQMSIGTMNALFARFIVGDRAAGIPAFGTPEEQALFREERLIADPEEGKPFKRGPRPINMTKTIQGIFKSCKDALIARTGWPKDWFEEIPKAKKCSTFVSIWKGNDVTWEDARKNARTKQEKIASIWYEFFLGLKGDIPGWTPPCRECPPRDKWMRDYRPGGERLGDLDDQIKVYRDILRRDPAARTMVQGMFDHILVDEAQDRNSIKAEVFDLMSEHITDGADGKSLWVVGDDKQCIHVDTPIAMATGSDVRAGDLADGDKVLAFRNGVNVPQIIRHSVKSSWTWGYRVTTAGGNQLTMSPNHKIWATDAIIPDEQVITYLMFRKDFGFRVGITNRHDDERRYGTRPTHEHADRLWVLGLHENREGALLEEESLSLEFGIPTQVFEGENRGLNQERIRDLFSRFGSNGSRLLEVRNLNFNLPHWFACSTTRGGTERRLIYVNAHALRGTNVRLEWSGDDLDAKLATENIPVHVGQRGNLRRMRKQFTNYREALVLARHLAELTGIPIRERLSLEGENLSLLPAAGLLVGMSLPVLSGDDVILDQIMKIEKVDGEFVDLDVDDASNFFGGGILSHNSIYQFNGARPELFTELYGKEGWTTRMIRTNYRCAPEIVEAANRLTAHNEKQIPMVAQANPQKARGRSSVLVSTPPDHASGAITTISRIVRETTPEPIGKGKKRQDYAVLSRTNRELNDYETACCLAEIPYARTGGKGLFDSPESRSTLGYVDLVYGTDFEKMARSLGDALTKPDRGLYMGADKVVKIVEETLGDIARGEGRSAAQINPFDLISKERYARELAVALKTPYRAKMPAWKFPKLVDELTRQFLAMGQQLSKIKITLTSEGSTLPANSVLESILDGISGTSATYDPDIRRDVYTTRTLRQQITEDLALFSDDEDEEEAPEEAAPVMGPEGIPVAAPKKTENPAKGLGAVQFLYLLSEQNAADIEAGTDPSTATGFLKKLTRIRENSDKLRVDLNKWAKANAAKPEAEREERPDCITLSTVHSVKGAEWRDVTVVMAPGVFPMERKPKPGEEPPTPEEVETNLVAERNLGYVALTRASESLTVLCPPMPKNRGLSRFVHEAGLVVGENVTPAVPPGVEEPVKTASWEEHGLDIDFINDLSAIADTYER